MSHRVVLQGLVRHHRPEVRTSHADVDHVAKLPSGLSLPLTAAERISRMRHPVENTVYLRDYIVAIQYNRRISRGTQCRMEDRSVSVELIFSPVNIASMRALRLASDASCNRG